MFETHRNTLFIDGCSTTELAKSYGTPLYVYSENQILEKLQEIRDTFIHKYPNTHAAYACKAFSSIYMCKLLENEGFWLDVVSGGELYTALKADFPPDRIEFNGNNKSIDEMIMALDHHIGRIVVDNLYELELLTNLCRKRNQTCKVLFRITPGVSSDTHKYITTGNKDSKFGIPLDENIIYPAIQMAIESSQLEFLGFHFHVGSQLQSTQSHLDALQVALKLIFETKVRFNYPVTDLNIGGGFGIRYTDSDNPLPLSHFVDPIMATIYDFCEIHDLDIPHVSMEPGRFIVGEAGIQLYTIGAIKTIPGVRTYVSVDGGMTDNLRPGLYEASYEAIIANKATSAKDTCVTISGKCCESTDILIQDLHVAEPESGDILAVFSTGAYGYSMASNYNQLPIPAVVVVKDGQSKLIIRRQTYEDLIRNNLHI
jgi:diaminopimelate decarboxylase